MEASTDWAYDGSAKRNSPKLSRSRRLIGIDPFERESRKAEPEGLGKGGWVVLPNGRSYFDAKRGNWRGVEERFPCGKKIGSYTGIRRLGKPLG